MADYTHARINTKLYAKLKERAKVKPGGTIQNELDNAVRFYLAEEAQRDIEEFSGIEKMLQHYNNKLDKHISSMIARVTMDVSMLLMGQVISLQKEFSTPDKQISEEKIMEILIKRGARYFTEGRKVMKQGFDEDSDESNL